MATLKIQPGQTLSGIARDQGTTVQDILKVNPQIKNPDLIFAGADLTLPGQQAPTTVTPPPQTIDVSTLTAPNKPVEIPQAEEVNTAEQFISSLTPPADQAAKGFEETLPSFQDVFKQADAITDPVQEERRGLLTRIEDSLGRLTGRGARQAELEQQAGVPEDIKRLQELNLQIQQTRGEFEKQIAALPGQGRGITTGIVAGQQARARRQQAVEVGALSSVAQAIQGNIALAQQTAQRTADLEFEPVEQEIANLRLLLDINKENMTTAERRRAELLTVQLDERQRQVDEQKANKETIITFAAEAAQNGADNVTVNNILKARTPEEALSVGSQFLAGPQDTNTQIVDIAGNKTLINSQTGETIRVLGPSDDSTPEPTQIGTDAFGNKIYGVFNPQTKTFDPVTLPNAVTMDSSELQNRVLDLTAGLSFGSVAEREDAKQGILNALSSGDTEAAKEILQTAVFNGASAAQQDTLEGKQNTINAVSRIEQSLNEYVQRGGDVALLNKIEFGKDRETGLWTQVKSRSLEKVGKSLDPQLSKIANDIALAIIDYRRAVSGAAFTESEGRAYEDAFPSIGKTAELNKAKIDSIKEKLQADADNFYKNRIGPSRYEGLFGTTSGASPTETPTLRSSFTNVSDLLRAQPEFTPLITAMKGDGLSDEEIRFVIQDQYSGFNQDLSTSLKGRISKANKLTNGQTTLSSMGRGTITGINGSKFWKQGLDFVLAGGKGARVPAPFSGEVLHAGENRGFGNQVKVRLDSGEEVWLSHLDSLAVKPGQRIRRGQFIGTQGNTGSVLGGSGESLSKSQVAQGRGTHLDITMKKPDGSFYTAREVAALLGDTRIS